MGAMNEGLNDYPETFEFLLRRRGLDFLIPDVPFKMRRYTFIKPLDFLLGTLREDFDTPV